MKIQIEVDCTPEEARAFLGLPDLRVLQRRVLDELERKTVEALAQSDPKALLDQWVPLGKKGMEQWQSLLGEMLRRAAGTPEGPGGKGKP
jgi:hypothetical protein